MTYAHEDQVFATAAEREAASRLSPAERQTIIEKIRVPYFTFRLGLSMIENLHRPVKGGLPRLGATGGLLGESRCGKTTICRAYADQHPPRDGETGMEYPVVYLDASVAVSRKRLGQKIQRATGCPHRMLVRDDPGEWSVDRLLKCRTELLIVDDAQFMFYEQRTSGAATELYGFVKDIVDTGRISVLLVGEDSIDTFVNGIAAFRGRSYTSETLRPLSSSAADLVLFGDLLRSIDRRLPFLEPSRLEHLRNDFYLYSGGHIGLIMNLVRDAAYLALNDRSACILIEHLREAVRTRIPPEDDSNYFGYKQRGNR